MNILVYTSHIYAQSSQSIKVPTKFSEIGSVFDSAYVISFRLKDFKYRFTPTTSDIYAAEALMIDKFPGKINNITTLNNFYRQYLGYIDQKDSKIIFVQLTNIKGKSMNINDVRELKSEFAIGFGDFYEVNVKRYYINITNNAIYRD